jgi:hypothetical protein
VSGKVGLSVLVLSAAVVACGGGAGALDRVPEGPWGGEHVSLLVRAAGAAVGFDCAHGEITVPMRLEGDGSFSLPGYYVRDAGPTFDPENRLPATYFGRSDGQRLTLAFILEDGSAGGPFTALAGGPGLVQQCR